MTKNYDNWERLVQAVLLRERFKELSLLSSPSCSSSGSRSSSVSIPSTSQLQNQSLGHSERNNHIRADSCKLAVDYSDLVIDHANWKAMLPPGHHQVVWTSSTLSFSLGVNRTCFMLGARHLLFSPRDDKTFERVEWVADNPYSRFKDVATIKDSYMVFIRGQIKAKVLSPETYYAAYLVFRKPEDKTEHQNFIAQKNFPINKEETRCPSLVFGLTVTHCRMLNDAKKGFTQSAWPKKFKKINKLVATRRQDGWMEVKMGDFYVNGGENGEVEARLLKIDYTLILIVEGIEFRPIVPKGKKWKLIPYRYQ